MHLYTVTKCRNRYDRCHCQLAINPWQIYSGSIVKIVKGKSYVKKKKEYLAPSILLHPLTTTSTVAFPLLSLSHPLFDINLLQVALIFTVPMALRLWSLYLRCHGHNSMTLRFWLCTQFHRYGLSVFLVRALYFDWFLGWNCVVLCSLGAHFSLASTLVDTILVATSSNFCWMSHHSNDTPLGMCLRVVVR